MVVATVMLLVNVAAVSAAGKPPGLRPGRKKPHGVRPGLRKQGANPETKTAAVAGTAVTGIKHAAVHDVDFEALDAAEQQKNMEMMNNMLEEIMEDAMLTEGQGLYEKEKALAQIDPKSNDPGALRVTIEKAEAVVREAKATEFEIEVEMKKNDGRTIIDRRGLSPKQAPEAMEEARRAVLPKQIPEAVVQEAKTTEAEQSYRRRGLSSLSEVPEAVLQEAKTTEAKTDAVGATEASQRRGLRRRQSNQIVFRGKVYNSDQMEFYDFVEREEELEVGAVREDFPSDEVDVELVRVQGH